MFETRKRLVLLLLVGLMLPAAAARGQGVDVANRPIAKITISGAKEVDEQFLLNQIHVKVGDPYDQRLINQDIQNLTRLGRFSYIGVNVEPNPDNTVNVTYVVLEQKLLSDVQVVGNKNLSDQDLMERILLGPGDPQDLFLIDRAREEIRKAYQEAGYFLADVSIDTQTLDETGILILRVREGPRVKVREIRFEGNQTFTAKELRSRIQTNTYIFIFRKGVLSREQLDNDEAELRKFYQDRGYLDVRVSAQPVLSDDQLDAAVTFVIDEGRLYTVANIIIEGNTVYPDAQLFQAMTLKVGDVFSQDRQVQSEDAVGALYLKHGMLEADVVIQRVFHETEPLVDLRVSVLESARTKVGAVLIRGNALTKDVVILRQVRGIEPGRIIDGTGIETTQRRIRSTAIIQEATITVQGQPTDEVRDVLIEVKEANTGSLSFGAAVSSDAGVFGAVNLTQRNFDITDTPESWGEFFRGRAFRGAGQFFSIDLSPGDIFQRYSVTFREPYIFDSDYFLDTNLFFFTRRREDWDEQRIGGTIGVGKRFGDVWSASVRTSLEEVSVRDVEFDAPIDAFAVEGDNFVDGLGFFITRSTVQTDREFLPYDGTRFQAGVEQVGIIGNDFDFTRLNGSFTAYLTLDEDFFQRKTTLALRVNAGYIINEDEITVMDNVDSDPMTPGIQGASHRISSTPLFERFYAGGHRTFRGFQFRGIGPRGIRADRGFRGNDPVGGDFLFLLGLEYNYPIYENVIRGVWFIDTGTVQEDLGFDEYRVSVGGGIRLRVPFLGSAPFAFDLAYPIVKEPTDEERIFSFDIAFPF